MSALIIGADRLGNIPEVLKENGIESFTHIPGRKKGMRNLKVPHDVDVVIFLIDFIEHCTLNNFKDQLKESNIPCLYCKRSVTDISEKLKNCKNCGYCRFS